MSQNNNNNSRPSFGQIILSVLAAMIGIQKGKNRERDFTKGNPWLFAVVGIIATVIFVLLLMGVVQAILMHVKNAAS